MRYQFMTKMHSSNIVLVFFLCLFSATKKGSAVLGNSLVLLNKNSDCVCSGQTLMFECKVTGVGSTVWQGSAFDCPLREIVLRHSQFVDSTGTCSDGAIVAQGVSVESNCYNSQLNVTLSSSLNGKSIVCAHHNNTGTTDIGTFMLNTISEPHPPPDNVHLNSINSRSLTFSWDPVNSSCHTLGYSITSLNCGVCPANTTDTSVTCHGVPVDGSDCQFQVQTTVCNNSHGPLSTSVTVTLKVCNPIVLGNVSLLPTDVTCDPPFHSLGIENGVVCYSGTEIGSVAFYSCIHCGLNFGTIKNGSSVRVCGEDGHWNGSTPQCSCQHQFRGNSNHLVLVIALSIVLVLFVVLVTFSVGCSASTCIFAKDRAKLRRQLEEKMIVYEEIDIKGQSPPNVDTTENIAYATASETVPTV